MGKVSDTFSSAQEKFGIKSHDNRDNKNDNEKP